VRNITYDYLVSLSITITLNRISFFQELEQWDKWEENPVVVIPDKPVNPVQVKIEQYRQQVVKPPESPAEEQLNFFEVILNENEMSS